VDSGGGDVQAACNAYLTAHNADLNPASGSTCTGTEKALFAKDTTGDCLSCAFLSGCLDDTLGDTGQECEDTGAGGITSGTMQQCINTLSCDLGVSPVNSPAPGTGLVVNAYCGQGNSISNCETGTGPAGKCIAPMVAGFPAGFSATQIVNGIAVRANASGMANALIACINSAASVSPDSKCNKCLE
jgi:hypothetical protein